MIARLTRLVFSFVSLLFLAGSPVLAQERIHLIMVSHGQPSDPFWGAVKSGAEQAARDMGVEFEYRAPPSFDVEAMAKLLGDAALEKPAGIIATIPNPDALKPGFAQVTGAGIPLVTVNSGFDVARSLGSLLHIGQSEYEAGRVAGERMRELGGVKALCINHELGNIALDLRCKGFIDGFGGSVEVLTVGPDPVQAKAAIVERLTGDTAIDVVLALNASIAGEPAVQSVAELGRPVRVATFDLTDGILKAVIEGRAAFAVDQQPFLQGYLPVQFLVLLARDGALPVTNVSTGPRLLGAADAARRLQDMERKTE